MELAGATLLGGRGSSRWVREVHTWGPGLNWATKCLMTLTLNLSVCICEMVAVASKHQRLMTCRAWRASKWEESRARTPCSVGSPPQLPVALTGGTVKNVVTVLASN